MLRFAGAQVAELLEGCLAHVQQPVAMPLPVGVQALATRAQRQANEIPKPKRLKTIHQRIPPFAKYIAASSGAFVLFFAAILIVLEFNKGTLAIESEFDNAPLLYESGTAGHFACNVVVGSKTRTIRFLKDGKDCFSPADHVLTGDQLTIYEHPPQKKVLRRGRAEKAEKEEISAKQVNDDGGFVTLPLRAEWVPEKWLKRNIVRRHLESCNPSSSFVRQASV